MGNIDIPDQTLAPRSGRLEPYAFLRLARAAANARQAGRDVISLANGEPDFPPPEVARSAAAQAILQGNTRYTAMDGMPELKEQVRLALARDLDLAYPQEAVTVTAGGTQVIFNAMLATVQEGDEVAYFSPYFPVYPSAVQFAGGTPRAVACDANLRPDLASLRAAVNARTRWLILNSPSNPSGVVLSADELTEIASILRAWPRVLVLSDDIYWSFNYSGRPLRTLDQIAPDLKDRVLHLDGLSKTYGMTGWRIGFAAGPVWLIEAIAQICSISTFTPNTAAQVGAIAALQAGNPVTAAVLAAYRERRDALQAALLRDGDLRPVCPEGAFYMFIDVRAWLARLAGSGIDTDMHLALHLIDQHGIACMPGGAFGVAGHLRLSFAAPTAQVLQGGRRLVRASIQT